MLSSTENQIIVETYGEIDMDAAIDSVLELITPYLLETNNNEPSRVISPIE